MPSRKRLLRHIRQNKPVKKSQFKPAEVLLPQQPQRSATAKTNHYINLNKIVSLPDFLPEDGEPRFPAPYQYTAMNPQYAELIADKLQRQHFMRHIGFELSYVAPGYIEGGAPLREDLKQQDGFIHGGVSATCADLVTGFAAFSLVGNDDRVVTSDLKISYFSPGKGEAIFARGWVIKPGARLMYCEGEIYSVEEGRTLLIAKAYAIMAVIRGKNKEIEGAR